MAEARANYLKGAEERAEQMRRSAVWGESRFQWRHKDAAEKGVTWPDPAKYELARDMVLVGGLVILWGPRGGGKTQMAACLGLDWVRRGAQSVEYWRFHDAMEAIKDRFQDPELPDRRSRLRGVGLLVLDEAQERYDTAFEQMTLTGILDARYGSRRPTVLITNVADEKLADLLGASVMSRAEETGVLIHIDWPSFRSARA